MLQYPPASQAHTLKLLKAAPEALAFLSREEAEALEVLPLSIEGEAIILALTSDAGPARVDQLAHRWKKVVIPHYAEKSCIMRSIADAYGRLSSKDIHILERDEAPAVRYVHWLFEEAVKRSASDIHLEPVKDCLRIRLRVDGRLHEYFSPPQRLGAALINRVKLMAGIPITAQHFPEEGRISAIVLGRSWDMRVSVLPAQGGASLVIRLLSRDDLPEALGELGFNEESVEAMNRMLSMGHGLILATGPTGSGKSTTLYTLLKRFDPQTHKIITIEDPIEYRLPGVTQMGVCEELGITFAEGLRAILRQAPDILMIGEIRDAETARIALNASMTGHLVLSTLHTMDAASAVTRLIELGVEPFLLSSVLKGIVAQRLVRRLCVQCKEAHPVSDYERHVLEAHGMSASELFVAKGCEFCSGTGFSGRTVVSECFRVGERFSSYIEEAPSLKKLRETLRDLGVQSLFTNGMKKVLCGETTLQEVLGVCVEE